MDTLCGLFGKSRQAYYKQIKYDNKVEIRSELILRFVKSKRKDMPKIGGRKLHYLMSNELPEELRLGRDSLFELLSAHGLLVKRRRYRVKTTYSNHWLKKYPNLIKGFVPDGPHQLLVSDITYILTEQGFMYLYLITDAYSRKIIGWDVADNLEAINAIKVLRQAIGQLPKEAINLIHHSDRGVQYCSYKYVKQLKKRNIKISMTENGDPLENAIAERVNGILKTEWIYGQDLLQTKQIKVQIRKIIKYYNTKRPHLSIDMLTPSEAHDRSGNLKRKWKNYYGKNNKENKNLEIDQYSDCSISLRSITQSEY
jgi:transposase InsO family protein